MRHAQTLATALYAANPPLTVTMKGGGLDGGGASSTTKTRNRIHPRERRKCTRSAQTEGTPDVTAAVIDLSARRRNRKQVTIARRDGMLPLALTPRMYWLSVNQILYGCDRCFDLGDRRLRRTQHYWGQQSDNIASRRRSHVCIHVSLVPLNGAQGVHYQERSVRWKLCNPYANGTNKCGNIYTQPADINDFSLRIYRIRSFSSCQLPEGSLNLLEPSQDRAEVTLHNNRIELGNFIPG